MLTSSLSMRYPNVKLEELHRIKFLSYIAKIVLMRLEAGRFRLAPPVGADIADVVPIAAHATVELLL